MSEDLDVKVFDNIDDAIKYLMNKYADTLIALSDCPNTTKEMKAMKYMDDKINHPKHYCEGRKYEPWDVIKDWSLDYDLGCAVKYISRAGRKDESKKLEDLEKAKAYLQHEIENIRKEVMNGRI